MVTTWNYPTAVRFGVGAINELPEACRALGMTNPLFVTDPVLGSLDVTQSVLQILKDSGLHHGVFSDIEANPVGGDVDKGVAQLRAKHAAHDDAPHGGPTRAASRTRPDAGIG